MSIQNEAVAHYRSKVIYQLGSWYIMGHTSTKMVDMHFLYVVFRLIKKKKKRKRKMSQHWKPSSMFVDI